jgi:hypothetical protein
MPEWLERNSGCGRSRRELRGLFQRVSEDVAFLMNGLSMSVGLACFKIDGVVADRAFNNWLNRMRYWDLSSLGNHLKNGKAS